MNRLLAFLLTLTTSFSWSQEIDFEHSYASFEISSFGISSVTGRIDGMSGTIQFDTLNPEQASFNVCIQPETINTGNAKRDNHLKDSDFFNIMYHPKICFTSTAVKARTTDYVAEGKLTMLGITQNATIVFTATAERLMGKMYVKRSNFSLGSGSKAMTIGDEAEVTIYCYFQ